MRSPDYTPLAGQLPSVYHEDQASYAQIDAYLGLADELNRAIVERLEDLMMLLGPDVMLRWPSDVPLNGGSDALLGSYLRTYDQVASWASFAFPSSWGVDEDGLRRRREFLARSARLWRRRGTPRGFVSWFCLYFGVSGDDVPYLLEHYKAPGAAITGKPYTATLFVPVGPFEDWARREEAVDFAHRYAPAHVLMRVCFIDPSVFSTLAVFTAAPTLPVQPTSAQLTTYAADIATQQADLNALLCSVVSVVDHGSAVHIYECVDEGRNIDRLGVGRLPTT